MILSLLMSTRESPPAPRYSNSFCICLFCSGGLEMRTAARAFVIISLLLTSLFFTKQPLSYGQEPTPSPASTASTSSTPDKENKEPQDPAATPVAAKPPEPP